MIDHSKHHGEKNETDSSFTVSRVLTGLAIGGAVVGAGIILAPHILPALGIGSSAMAEEAMFVLHTSVEAGGSGLAGVINSGLAAVPIIGGNLAAGGLFNAAATALTGIGGVMLGNFIERKEDGKVGLKWGKIIKYAALATSAMIALPTVLTALGTGLIYLSTLTGNVDLAIQVIGLVDKTLGAAGGMSHALMGFSGVAAVIPHFLTCGMAMLPAALSVFLAKDKKTPHEQTEGASEHKYSDGSVTAEMVTDGKLEAGKPVNGKLILKHRNGQPVNPDELAVVHTEKLHLFVADSSLKDYHHIHPQPTSEPGVMAFTFTPQTANNYSAWADFTMIKDGQNHKLRTEMPAASGRNIPPSIRANTNAEKSDLRFDWQSDPLQKDAATIVKVNVTDADGKPAADLEPVMGAFAHLVGFSADGKSIIHTHPLDAEPQNATDRGGPRLRFHVEPDCVGATQFYLQVKRGGEDIYVPFGQQIKPSALATERATASSHAAMGHAM